MTRASAPTARSSSAAWHQAGRRAQAAIEAGLVTADGVRIEKASQPVFIRCRAPRFPRHPYVSARRIEARGGARPLRHRAPGARSASISCFHRRLQRGLLERGARSSMPSMSATGSFTLRCRAAAASCRSSEPMRARSTRAYSRAGSNLLSSM